MGTIVNFIVRAIARPATLEEQLIANVERARNRVERQLSRCDHGRVVQAQARAERLVRAGLDVDSAVRRAHSWAMYATEPCSPNTPATA